MLSLVPSLPSANYLIPPPASMSVLPNLPTHSHLTPLAFPYAMATSRHKTKILPTQ